MISVDNILVEKVESSKSSKVKYNFEGTILFAEETAIQFYNQKGFKATWSENHFWWTILSILFWDVIFAKVKGSVAFNNGDKTIFPDPKDKMFQYLFDQFTNMNGMPHDFFSPEFYERRKALIENHITQLVDTDLSEIFQNLYNTHNGKNCRLIEDWKRYSLDELLVPFKTCEAHQIIGILTRILKNVKDHRSGLPDIIVHNENYLFFSEVKSENDKLRPNQIEWHKYLSEQLYFDVEILLFNHDKSQKEKVLKSYCEPEKKLPNSKPRKETGKKLLEPNGELIDSFRAQVMNIPRDKQIDQYFIYLNQIRELRSQKKFDQMLDLCKKSLPLIESVIKWDESSTKQKWDGTNGLTMPAIDCACDYLPILKRTDELIFFEKFINSMPKLEYYKQRIENAFLMLEIVQKLEPLLKRNDFVFQKDFKKHLGIQDGRTISRVINYLENTHQITRSKSEKTYKIIIASQAQKIYAPNKTTSQPPKEKKSFFQKLFGA